MVEPARPLSERKEDVLLRLANDKDLWIGTSDGGGEPTLVPLSFLWDGAVLVIATVATNPTGKNIVQTGQAKVVLGLTRDVVLIDVAASLLDPKEVAEQTASAYMAKLGWDPRESPGYRFYRLTPRSVESWRELNEHADRLLMRDGQWLV